MSALAGRKDTTQKSLPDPMKRTCRDANEIRQTYSK